MHPECRHIMPNGNKCRAAALRDKPYCYFHDRTHRITGSRGRTKKQPIQLPILEDRSAIQLALAQILDALAAARIDAKRASLLLYGLQIASQNVRGDSPNLSDDTVRFVFRSKGGRELAPEKLACDPDDCKSCKSRDRCILYRAAEALSGGPDPDDDPPALAPTPAAATVARARTAPPQGRLLPPLNPE
jgi:hypothetical protein